MGRTRKIEFSHRKEVDGLPRGQETYYDTIRRLGDDGFEMFWMFDSGDFHVLWFKRPLEDEN